MTIAGMHTPIETRELIAQKNRDITGYNVAFKNSFKRWSEFDHIGAKSWGDDWAKFLDRWKNAVRLVEIQLHAIETNLMFGLTSEAQYQQILRALQLNPGRYERGDFPDFIDRWVVASNALKLQTGRGLDDPEIDTKQPISLDIDLETFKKADSAVKTLEKDVFPTLGYVGIGAGVLGLIYLLKR